MMRKVQMWAGAMLFLVGCSSGVPEGAMNGDCEGAMCDSLEPAASEVCLERSWISAWDTPTTRLPPELGERSRQIVEGGHIVERSDSGSEPVRLTYEKDRLTRVSEPSFGESFYEYDDAGRLTRERSRERDGVERIVRDLIHEERDGAEIETERLYGEGDKVSTLVTTARDGRVVAFQNDYGSDEYVYEDGRVVKTIRRTGTFVLEENYRYEGGQLSESSLEYDAGEGPRGWKRRFSYDGRAVVVHKSVLDAAGWKDETAVRYTLSPNGHLEMIEYDLNKSGLFDSLDETTIYDACYRERPMRFDIGLVGLDGSIRMSFPSKPFHADLLP